MKRRKPPQSDWSPYAYQCAHCPEDGRHDGTSGCPRWLSKREGFHVQDAEDKEPRRLEGCLDGALMAGLLRSLTVRTNQTAAAAEEARNAATAAQSESMLARVAASRRPLALPVLQPSRRELDAAPPRAQVADGKATADG